MKASGPGPLFLNYIFSFTSDSWSAQIFCFFWTQFWQAVYCYKGFQGGSVIKNPLASAGDVGSIPVSGRPLEKKMATHFTIPARIISWTEERCGLQSMRSQSDVTW